MKKTIVLALLLNLFSAIFASAQNIDIVGPAGSDSFGEKVYALPNGNIVVIDPEYDIPSGAANAGAVYLYNGTTAALISAITGSTADDRVGTDGIVILSNGNFVIRSFAWDNGAATNAGAVTWCSGTAGCTGTVSAANSLVGSSINDSLVLGVAALTNGNYVVRNPAWDNAGITNAGAVTWCDGTTGCAGAISPANSFVGAVAEDLVGLNGVTPLTNGNFVIGSSSWDNGGAADAGAVTFASGTTAITGTISAANSLVGSQSGDEVGGASVVALPNGNYVVNSSGWNNGAATNAGAITFGNGTTGITGVVSAANSLVGTSANDSVGSNNVIVLTNGNYVVASIFWRNGASDNAGAVTWCDGTTGCAAGPVSSSNSLVGTTAEDNVGGSITLLTNGNYIVRSQAWDRGAIANAGAVTFGNGTTGVSGPVSFANSLVGSTNTDLVGNITPTALTNGNYVVFSPNWDNFGIVNAGAATLCNGVSGCFGTISPGNSLVGTTTDDRVGSGGGIALTNGNYIVFSPDWDNGAITTAGAVTFGNGTTGVAGPVSAANSLVGSTTGDRVGISGGAALTGGNYVVGSLDWDNGAMPNVGAATFGNGTTGVSGTISAANSLIGSSPNDTVSSGGLYALTNGNYLVNSSGWDNGGITNVGAITFANGTTGIAGAISGANSLIGSVTGDNVGNTPVTVLPFGNYIVRSNSWDNGAITNAGAITRGGGNVGTNGMIDSTNSVLGTTMNGGTLMSFVYDTVNRQLVVGRPADNIVTLSRPFGPSAASVSISGRVTGGKNSQPLRATVSLTDIQGIVRQANTSSFGYYKFENVPAGRTYIVQISAKGGVFNPRIITPTDDVEDLNFFTPPLRVEGKIQNRTGRLPRMEPGAMRR